MFIAHAPFGYILGELTAPKVAKLFTKPILVIAVMVLGSLFPDIDMLYFYLIDHRHTHHHKYMTHWPIVWLGLILMSLAMLWVARNKKNPLLLFLFGVTGFLHLVLDSVVGDIWWFAPFVDKPYAMFTVPSTFSPWWLNFVLHWSFALELGICVVAFVMWRQQWVLAYKGQC